MSNGGMSEEKIAEALNFYREYLEKRNVPIKQYPVKKYLSESDAISKEEVVSHCHWMAVQAKVFLSQGRREKAMRWLCFIQGCMFTLRNCRIYDLKN